MRITDTILADYCDTLCAVTGMEYQVRHRNGYAGLDLMNGSAVRDTLATGTNREIYTVIGAILSHELYRPNTLKAE